MSELLLYSSLPTVLSPPPPSQTTTATWWGVLGTGQYIDIKKGTGRKTERKVVGRVACVMTTCKHPTHHFSRPKSASHTKNYGSLRKRSPVAVCLIWIHHTTLGIGQLSLKASTLITARWKSSLLTTRVENQTTTIILVFPWEMFKC